MLRSTERPRSVPTSSGKNQTDGAGKKETSTSFWKKRSKKLFRAVASLLRNARQKTKVFWFYFSKKNTLPALASHAATLNADYFV
jgi:hypothetical protein